MPNVHIALVMMVKNEQKRLHVTLNSVLNHIDSVVIYDTGSTDDTIDIAKKFCEKHKIPLRLKQGEFVDFAASRNVLLDFADTFYDIDYLLLMDTNDELKGGDILRRYCIEYKSKMNTGFLLCQEWWSGQYDKYYNVRLVKARQKWRYRGRVHEWIENTRYNSDDDAQKAGDHVIRIEEEDLVLYQDRTQDDNKSGKRFTRDKELLLEDHKDDPTEPRIVFYLAQTFSCLGEFEDSYYYYKLRTTLDGFWEEKYSSYNRCGELAELLGNPWEECMKWYIKAFEHTTRAEPLLKIAEYYKEKNWLLCYTFSDLACKLAYPSHCILFVDKLAYDYKRWHLLGISGWYAGFYTEGKLGCIKAIEHGMNIEIDKSNLQHYLDREAGEAKLARETMTNVDDPITPTTITNNNQLTDKQIKNQASKITCKQLSEQYPNLSMKQIHNKVKRLNRK